MECIKTIQTHNLVTKHEYLDRLGVRMCMMPCSAPCANVSIQIWCQKLYAAGLVEAQRTVQNYGYTCFLLLNSCPLLALFWLWWWTNFFAFLFLRVTRSRLRSALNFAKYVHCKGQAALSSLSSITRKHCPTSLCNTRISNAQVPEHKHKLTFQAWPQIVILSMPEN